GTRLTSVVLIPIAAAYLVMGSAITSVLFQYGRYDASSAKSAALVVAVAGLGLVPFAISQLQTFAFYALTETRTAALVNIPVVATKVIVDVTIYYTVDAKYVAAGLMLGNLLSYLLGALLSARLLRSRLGPMGQGAVFATVAKLMIAGAVGAAACFGTLSVLNLVLGDSKLANLVRLGLGGLVLGLVYLAAAWAMRVHEVGQVLDMVNRKLGGRLPVPSRKTDASDRAEADAPATSGRQSAAQHPGQPPAGQANVGYGQPEFERPEHPVQDGGAPARPVRRRQGTVYGSRARRGDERSGYPDRPYPTPGKPGQRFQDPIAPQESPHYEDPPYRQEGSHPGDGSAHPRPWEGR
ncbi:MAG TPA: lipid II flippase MurJ, partial [Micromonosporaceae bacterium]|nr:lipid II flippase MurJ [Micromonosporaceae bacterium]